MATNATTAAITAPVWLRMREALGERCAQMRAINTCPSESTQPTRETFGPEQRQLFAAHTVGLAGSSRTGAMPRWRAWCKLSCGKRRAKLKCGERRGSALTKYRAASEPRIKLQLGKYLSGSESIAKEAARSGLIPTESYELRSCIG